MNSDATWSRRRSRQDGAAGLGAPQPRSGKWPSLACSRGPALHPRSRPRNTPRGARCHVRDSGCCHGWIWRNRTSDFSESSSTCRLFTSTAYALLKLLKPRSRLSAQRLHRWSRNVVLIDRSLCELGCRRLLAQLLRLAVTVAVGWMSCGEHPEMLKPRSPRFPVLCVTTLCAGSHSVSLEEWNGLPR